jgi:translocation and assembly module TamA
VKIRRLLALVLCLWAVACTPARREVQGQILRSTHFIGNGGVGSGNNDYQLRQQMVQKNTPFGLTLWPLLYVIEPKVLRDEVLARDAWRLEVWYAHHGWFDARLLGWQLREVRQGSKRRAAIIDAVGYVERGAPTLLRNIDIEGLSAGAGLARSALRHNGLEPEVQFDLDTIDYTEAEILANLRNNSYAYAQVTSRIAVDPEAHTADVAFVLDPGINAKFGPVTLEGNEKVRSKYILDNVIFEEGDTYSKAQLDKTQRQLFGMGTFSVVSVQPVLTDPTVEAVPIQVRVSEAKFRTLRLGGGLTFDGIEANPQASARFTDTNLFRELVRLELGATVGLSYATSESLGLGELQPTYDLQGAISYPRLAGPHWGIELRGRYLRDKQAGLWLYENPEADLGFIFKPRPGLLFRFGPHYELYRYLVASDEDFLQFAQSLFGKSFTNPFTLTALDQQVIADGRDDPLFTTRGRYGSLFTREVFPIREDSYAYLLAEGETRFYRPLGPIAGDLPLIGALRLHGKYLYPLEGRALPYPELAFLGGGNSLRGFRTNQVGPYDSLCTYPPGGHLSTGSAGNSAGAIASDGNHLGVEHYYLPHGGQVALDGTFELRYDWLYGVSFAGFAEGGWLAENINHSGLQDVRWDVGLGGRYRSPVGPIRLDFAFRPLYPEDQGPTEVIGCDPADVEDRYFDIFSLFGDSRPVPVAVLFFLAIGEAF